MGFIQKVATSGPPPAVTKEELLALQEPLTTCKSCQRRSQTLNSRVRKILFKNIFKNMFKNA